MKRLFTKFIVSSLVFMTIGGFSQAQVNNIDFETVGKDWTWDVFENGNDDPALYSVVTNPDKSGINTSEECGKYIVNANAQPWAGIASTDIGEFTFDETNSTVKIMVYKTIISPVGMKFENADNSLSMEIKIPNTVVNEWEELTFDFTPHIGKTVAKLVLFPDFPDPRTAGSTNYFDNIVFEDGTAVILAEPTVAAPTPTAVQEDVISIFSNTYNNIAGANYNPYWEQATEFSMFDVAGKDVLKYAFLNYQGIEFDEQNVTGMNFINIDVWSPDATSVNFSLISNNSGEKSVLLSPIAIEAWTTFSIPLTEYSSQGLNLDKIYQFKLDLGSSKTFYVDNLYFSKENPASVIVPSENVNISIYPNPVIDKISVSSIANIKSIRIESLTGKQVLYSTEKTINLGSIPSGVYLISVELENGEVSTHKIIKL